jgi:hypothetical protein
MIEEWPRVYFHPSSDWIGYKKALLCRACLSARKGQAAFFLALVFFFLAAFLAALGVSAAGLAGAAAGVAAGAAVGADAGAAAGAAGMTGAVGAAVWATEARAKALKAPAMMSLYMELPSR